MTYRVVKIPEFDLRTSEAEQLALANKFREFRLFALKTAPGAFASNYEVESQRGIEQTFERLRNAKATQFVALMCENPTTSLSHVCEGEMSDLLSHDWLGFIVLLGPDASLGTVSAAKNPFSQITGMPKSDAPETKTADDGALRYHLNGMFVHPSARRHGIGEHLVKVALDAASAMSVTSGHGFRCGIITDEWNTTAKTLYERVGFRVVARETYNETRVALRMALNRTAEEMTACKTGDDV